jgi:hypothetical protein
MDKTRDPRVGDGSTTISPLQPFAAERAQLTRTDIAVK